MRLGKILSDWRKFNGLSLRNAAKTIDIDYSSLRRFEAGDSTNIKFETLTKILLWTLSKDCGKAVGRRLNRASK